MIALRMFWAVALVLGARGLPASAFATPSLEIYGRLPGFENARLSPSGKRVAINPPDPPSAN